MSIIVIATANSINTRRTAVRVEENGLPLKSYYNSVREFINDHRREPDFSFKLIDRPPVIDVFGWYHQTCIDGLFNNYISYDKPKYLLQYDYKHEKLNFSLYNDRSVIIGPGATSPIFNSDYVNSIGMDFKEVFVDDKSLLISVTEVTQKQWNQVMGYNPSRFVNDAHPVENVSFKMAQKFISRLNQMEKTHTYRLPAEKEYSQLIDTSSIAFYNIQREPNKYAWLQTNSDSVTHAAGTKVATSEGLFDIIGNVWEWTSTDIHPGSPAAGYEDNPRICFGLSWRDKIEDSENIVTNYPPDFRHSHLGFRIACELKNNKREN